MLSVFEIFSISKMLTHKELLLEISGHDALVGSTLFSP